MRRRTVLVALAATTTGCLDAVRAREDSSDDDERGRTGTDPGPSTPTPTVDGRLAEQDIVEFDPGNRTAVERVQVGDDTPSDRVNAHDVVVWNDGEERRIRIVVHGGSDLRIERTVSLSADGFVAFSLTQQVPYRISVGVVDGPAYGFRLPADLVDCNSSRTTVRVPPDGPVQYSTLSTAVACIEGTGTPEGSEG